MRLNTYLNYGGNCADAFRFYEKNLGGKIGMMMTHGEMPGQDNVAPETKMRFFMQASQSATQR